MVEARPQVVVVGGGFGGLEAAFYLRWRLGDRTAITLVSDRDYFLFKPNTIYVPFGLEPRALMVPLAEGTGRKGIRLLVAPVREVDPVAKTVAVDGERLRYDFLVLATGAAMRPEEVPGLREHAHNIWTPEDMLRLRQALTQLAERARAQLQRVLFLVPPNNKCSGPLYEIALMLETWLRRQGLRDRVHLTWATCEASYIQAFGPRLHGVVEEEFRRRGIEGYTGLAVERVEEGRVLFAQGRALEYDLLVSFPPYVAAVPYPGLPTDDRGFLLTEMATRQVKGHPEVYAVGDASDFPVKQAFLALLQADAAAEHIAAQVLGEEFRASFLPTSMCIMEQYDRATFAQVPLRLTGDPARPVEVLPEALGQYKVGTSPAWRLGKKLLGLYLPWRFRRGEPFHAGAPWRAMELGLKVMARVLAH